MTIHRIKIKDMKKDLDDLIKYSREFNVQDVNITVFVLHMDFVYDRLESLQKQIQDLTEWANK